MIQIKARHFGGRNDCSEKRINVNATHFWDAFHEIDAYLNSDQLPVVELRPKARQHSEALLGDYDYLIDSRIFEVILRKLCEVSVKYNISILATHEKKHKKRVFLFGPNGEVVLFEFWGRAEVVMQDNFTNKQMRTGYSYHAYKKASEKIGKTAVLALIYVCHLHTKNKEFGVQVHNRLSYFIEKLTVGADEQGDYSGAIACLLAKLQRKQLSVKNANDSAIELLSSVGCKTNPMLPTFVFEKMINKSKKQKPKSKITPIVGPDGCGKTTFISKLAERNLLLGCVILRFKSLFRESRAYNLFRRIFGQRGLEIKFDENHASLVAAISLIGYFRLARKAKCVVMDRWFLEFMVTGYRTNLHMPSHRRIIWYKLCTIFIPKPHSVIILTTDFATLVHRKDELSLESVEYFYNSYVEYVCSRKIKNCFFLSSTCENQEMVDVYQMMQERAGS